MKSTSPLWLTSITRISGFSFRRVSGDGCDTTRWKGFVVNLRESLSRKGMGYSVSLPLLWLGLYFSLAIHLRLGLGHWPTAIGQGPETLLFSIHQEVTWELMVFIARSVFAISAFGLICAFFGNWRHYSVYALSYCIAAFAAYLLMNMAPSSFVYWWWD